MYNNWALFIFIWDVLEESSFSVVPLSPPSSLQYCKDGVSVVFIISAWLFQSVQNK